MNKILLGALLIFSCFGVTAQNGSISGTVTDENEISMPGATVLIKEISQGAATDIDGKYTIENIEPGTYTVVISVIGFISNTYTIELAPDEKKILNSIIKEDVLKLDELIVIGYGTKQKRDVTGSISTIRSEDLENAVTPSIDQALQGKAAGVQITSASGVAGGGSTKIQIRGTNSINAGSQPLIVVDGVPINNADIGANVLGSGTNGLADINMDDVASIDILKDAASAAIYGARGANGVILITTKKGAQGKTKFNFNYKTGIVTETNRLKLLSAKEHLALRDQRSMELYGTKEDSSTVLAYADGNSYTRAEADSFAATGGSDWIDETLQMGNFHEVNLSASSGTEKNRVYFSGAYRDEESFLKGNQFQRIAGRLNVENRTHKNVTIGANIGLTYSINNRVPTGDNGGLGWAQQIPTYIPIYNADGSYFNEAGNPLWYLDNHTFTANRFRSLSNLYTDFKIFDFLSFHTSFGLDYTGLTEDEYQAKNAKANSEAWAWERNTNVLNWNNSNYFTFNKKVKEKHDLNVIAGADLQRSYSKGIGIYGYQFTNDNFRNPQQAVSQSLYSYETGNGILSYYGRLSYKMNNKYLVNLTARTDASSRFSDQHRYGFFPSISAGWIISDENFMKDNKVMNYLKLKASYGLTGNDNIGDFTRYGLYSTGTGYNGGLAIYPVSLANDDLKWEKAKMLDVTTDYAFFNSKISGSFTYFFKQSSDLLLPIQLPTSSGYSQMTINAGVVNNQGIETMLTTHNIDKKNFSWTSDFNYTRIRNKVMDVADLPPDAFESGQPGEGRVIVDYPVGQTYVVQYAGVMDEDGSLTRYEEDGGLMLDENDNTVTVAVDAGEALYYDRNGNLMAFGVDDRGTTSDESDDVNRFTGTDFYDNRVPRGNPAPKFYAGINNTLRYKAFDLSFLLNVVWGHTIYDDPAKSQIGLINSYAQRPEIQDAWTEDNVDSDVPSLSSTSTPVNSDRYLYDASYIRLRSLTLGYTLPKRICQKIKVSNLKIYATGYNLWTWTKYPGWDPEVMRHVPSNGKEENISFSGPSWQTPQAKIMLIGIKLGL
ncbi:MAG: TonB-dependent receptor [Flavobacteriales bacterium]|nr:TonB-dependent receptor [Flavobacteriales bacterium]